MEESRAREIAYEFARKSFHDMPFVEHEGSMHSQDGVRYVYKPTMRFVPQEQTNFSCKFRAAWVAFFMVDLWLESMTMHGHMEIYIDAETEEIWEKHRHQNRKPTAQEKLSDRKARRLARRNNGRIDKD
jgi:hypothetical protein